MAPKNKNRICRKKAKEEAGGAGRGNDYQRDHNQVSGKGDGNHGDQQRGAAPTAPATCAQGLHTNLCPSCQRQQVGRKKSCGTWCCNAPSQRQLQTQEHHQIMVQSRSSQPAVIMRLQTALSCFLGNAGCGSESSTRCKRGASVSARGVGEDGGGMWKGVRDRWGRSWAWQRATDGAAV